MKKVLIVIAVIILLVVVWLFTLPGKYSIERSVEINASQEEVFDIVADFTKWPVWSPWLIMEPDASLNYQGAIKTVGSKYNWEGELVGSGEMEIISMEEMNQINYDLRFKTPYKSEAKVSFHLTKNSDGQTTATWGMKGEMPFFMRFMTKMMVTYITMDYDRGLSMLKDLAETGSVFSKITYSDIVEVDNLEFIGIRHEISINTIGEVMQRDFEDLSALFTEKGYVISGPPMSVYYTMDFATGVTDFATAFPVKYMGEMEVPDNFIKDEIESEKAFTVIHTGKYEHLGNAWSAAMQYARTNKLKANMKATMWEVYTNNPHEVESAKDYETVVYLPLK